LGIALSKKIPKASQKIEAPYKIASPSETERSKRRIFQF